MLQLRLWREEEEAAAPPFRCGRDPKDKGKGKAEQDGTIYLDRETRGGRNYNGFRTIQTRYQLFAFQRKPRTLGLAIHSFRVLYTAAALMASGFTAHGLR